MNLSVKPNVTPTTVLVEGRIDTNTAPAFTAYVDKLVDHGITSMVVDLSDCDFVSSAGLRSIVALQKRLIDGRLVFTGVRPEVMNVFEMTGFDKFLEFA